MLTDIRYALKQLRWKEQPGRHTAQTIDDRIQRTIDALERLEEAAQAEEAKAFALELPKPE